MLANMTRIPEILGPDYDSPANLPESLAYYRKQRIVGGALKRAETTGDAATVELLNWELGILTLSLAPSENVSPFQGLPYEAYAQSYQLTDQTVAYARERAAETQDLILKIHYLMFVLLRSEPKGRAWFELQRELLTSYREYISGSLKNKENNPKHILASCIDLALKAATPLISRPGIIKKDEQPEWAQWFVSLAEQSLTFPREAQKEFLRHRWIADYLEHLTELPPATASQEVQAKATALLSDAAAFYEADPFADTHSYKVAEVESKLRKHWGEPGDKAHERKIRSMFNATLRRAGAFLKAGNGIVAAHLRHPLI